MGELSLLICVVLLLTIPIGLIRVVRGPTAADRMLAAQLFGTTGVAVLLLLSDVLNSDVIIRVALVFALLAAVTVITFVRRTWRLNGQHYRTENADDYR